MVLLLRQEDIFNKITITTTKGETCEFKESAYLFEEMYYQQSYTEILSS